MDRELGMSMGRELRSLRRRRGLNLAAVEGRTAGRIKASTLASYERGERRISVERLVQLAEVYEVAADAVLRRSLARREERRAVLRQLRETDIRREPTTTELETPR